MTASSKISRKFNEKKNKLEIIKSATYSHVLYDEMEAKKKAERISGNREYNKDVYNEGRNKALAGVDLSDINQNLVSRQDFVRGYESGLRMIINGITPSEDIDLSNEKSELQSFNIGIDFALNDNKIEEATIEQQNDKGFLKGFSIGLKMKTKRIVEQTNEPETHKKK